MPTRATVEIVNPRSGSVMLRAADDSYVLAQQVDALPLRPGQVLSGAMDSVGVESLTDPDTGAGYAFFIEAWGLSREAALDSLH